MNIGLKVYPKDMGYIRKCIHLVDFMEVLALPGFDYSILFEYNIPYVLHCAHHGFGFNLADPAREEHNKNCLDFALSLADKLNCESVIVHPGGHTNNNHTLGQAIKLLSQYSDTRITLESMPCYCVPDDLSLRWFGHDPAQLESLINKGNFGMCLDFVHSAAAAFAQNIDYFEYLKKFVSINPRNVHISDGLYQVPFDFHMHIGDGNLDIERFVKMLPDCSWITIETDLELEKQVNDINLIKRYSAKL